MKEIRAVNFFVMSSITWILTACSSTGLQAQRVDSPNSSAISKGPKPEGFIEDAMELGEFNLFPEQVDAKISKVLSTQKDAKLAMRAAQAVVCDGRKPRFSPIYKVRLVIPKAPQGTAVDIASKTRENFIKTARLYLKDHFFDAAAAEPDNGGKYNADYAGYILPNDGKEYRRPNLALAMPIVYAQDKKSLANYYANLRLLPTAYGPNGPRDYIYWQHLYSIVFPKDRMAILVPRVFTFVGTGEKLEEPGIGLVDNSTLIEFRGNYFPINFGNGHLGSRQFFTVSDSGWKIENLKNGSWGYGERSELKTDTPLYPLHVSTMADLYFLKQHYSFMLPKEVICRIEFPHGVSDDGPEGRQAVDCSKYGKERSDLRQWGYDSDSGAFSATEAVGNKNLMWERILQSQTSIREAAQSDGSLMYELGLNLSLFCQYGTPVTELVSQ